MASFGDPSFLECLQVEEHISLIVHEPMFTAGRILIRQEVVTEREGEGGWGLVSGGCLLCFAPRLQVWESAEQQVMQVGVKELSIEPESCQTLHSMAEFVEELPFFLSFLKWSKGPDLTFLECQQDQIHLDGNIWKRWFHLGNSATCVSSAALKVTVFTARKK